MIKNTGIHQLDVQKNLLNAELDKLRDLIIHDKDLIPEEEFFIFMDFYKN